MSEEQTTPEASEPAASEPRSNEEQPDPLRGSRTSGLWTGLALISVLLILLIVFIAQNTDSVQVAFLGWQGEAPLSVALLAAAVAGLLLAVTAGSLRILQLRRRVRRERH